MKPQKNDFRVRLNGNSDIFHYQPKPSLASFSHGIDYELEQARLYAGLSPSEWNKLGGSHIWAIDGGLCKADYLVLFRINGRINTVGEDIKARHTEQQMKRSRAKGRP